MPVAMLRYEDLPSDNRGIFTEFGRASSKAQEFEALLKLNLQYELALADTFADLKESDASAEKHGDYAMGPIYQELRRFLKDDGLKTMIERALATRNALVHRFFFDHGLNAGAGPQHIEAALLWCKSATSELSKVCGKLEERWIELDARSRLDPDSHVPGMAGRISAIERGEWP